MTEVTCSFQAEGMSAEPRQGGVLGRSEGLPCGVLGGEVWGDIQEDLAGGGAHVGHFLDGQG